MKKATPRRARPKRQRTEAIQSCRVALGLLLSMGNVCWGELLVFGACVEAGTELDPFGGVNVSIPVAVRAKITMPHDLGLRS